MFVLLWSKRSIYCSGLWWWVAVDNSRTTSWILYHFQIQVYASVPQLYNLGGIFQVLILLFLNVLYLQRYSYIIFESHILKKTDAWNFYPTVLFIIHYTTEHNSNIFWILIRCSTRGCTRVKWCNTHFNRYRFHAWRMQIWIFCVHRSWGLILLINRFDPVWTAAMESEWLL